MTHPLDRLARTIDARAATLDQADDSWTARLLARGTGKCAEKFGEEAVEAIIAAVKGDRDELTDSVIPLMGTLVVFLSEKVPHEVSAAKRLRHSIAGWFRVNTSLGPHIDPPA